MWSLEEPEINLYHAFTFSLNGEREFGIMGLVMSGVVSCMQVASEKDFLDAVNKVIKAYAKFSSTPRYMTYN